MRRLFYSVCCAAATFALGGLVTRFSPALRPLQATPPTAQTFALEGRDNNSLKCDKDPKLPPRIKILLDQSFPGWRFQKASTEDCEWVKTSVGPHAYPEMIQGDFDGNGQLDYAMQIDYYADTYPNIQAYPSDVCLVAFLANDTGYVKRVVSHNEGGFLLLMEKGSRDYDYGTQSEFVYANDTISAGSQKGGMSYLYEKGKFRAIISSD